MKKLGIVLVLYFGLSIVFPLPIRAQNQALLAPTPSQSRAAAIADITIIQSPVYWKHNWTDAASPLTMAHGSLYWQEWLSCGSGGSIILKWNDGRSITLRSAGASGGQKSKNSWYQLQLYRIDVYDTDKNRAGMIAVIPRPATLNILGDPIDPRMPLLSGSGTHIRHYSFESIGGFYGDYSDFGNRTAVEAAPSIFLPFLKEELKDVQQDGNQSKESVILNEIGLAYADLGKSEAALSYFHSALEIQERKGDKQGEATSLNNIGVIYQRSGQSKRSFIYFEKELSLFGGVDNKSRQVTILNNIGRAYELEGDSEKANEFYDHALEAAGRNR